MSLRNTYRSDGDSDALDRFYTPPDVASVLVSLLPDMRGQTAIEPYKGGGAFADAMAAAGCAVTTMDIDPGSNPDIVHDALRHWELGVSADWCSTNPPFSKGSEAHAEACLGMARNVALLVPVTRICNVGWDPIMRQMVVGYLLQTRVTFVGQTAPFPQPLVWLRLRRGHDNGGAWVFHPIRLDQDAPDGQMSLFRLGGGR